MENTLKQRKQIVKKVLHRTENELEIDSELQQLGDIKLWKSNQNKIRKSIIYIKNISLNQTATFKSLLEVAENLPKNFGKHNKKMHENFKEDFNNVRKEYGKILTFYTEIQKIYKRTYSKNPQNNTIEEYK